MFQIEDEIHAEPQTGNYETLEYAIEEFWCRALLPWDEPPNRAPCRSWEKCGREYVIIEYDTSTKPWKLLQRLPALEIACAGVKWLINLHKCETLSEVGGN